MFSLIIVIISIALVAAIAIATLWYGGTQFSQGQNKAIAARVLNEGSQLLGATRIYQADHGNALPNSVQDLVNAEYLRNIEGLQTEWSMTTDYFVTSSVPYELCQEINRQIGVDSVPSCEDAGAIGRSLCCEMP